MVKKIFVKLRIDKIERHSLDQILSSKIKIGVIVKHKAPKNIIHLHLPIILIDMILRLKQNFQI